MRSAVALAFLLAACGGDGPPERRESPGAQLEAAAIEAGLVPDPNRPSLVGTWSRGTDRVCIAPGRVEEQRIGVLIDYGEGEGCVASGTVRRSGERLDVRFGSCRIDARFDGGRIGFPAEVDEGCARFCSGDASMAALSVEQVSGSAAEATALRAPSGRLLCGS